MEPIKTINSKYTLKDDVLTKEEYSYIPMCMTFDNIDEDVCIEDEFSSPLNIIAKNIRYDIGSLYSCANLTATDKIIIKDKYGKYHLSGKIVCDELYITINHRVTVMGQVIVNTLILNKDGHYEVSDDNSSIFNNIGDMYAKTVVVRSVDLIPPITNINTVERLIIENCNLTGNTLNTIVPTIMLKDCELIGTISFIYPCNVLISHCSFREVVLMFPMGNSTVSCISECDSSKIKIINGTFM
jgi:hypothetical protein